MNGMSLKQYFWSRYGISCLSDGPASVNIEGPLWTSITGNVFIKFLNEKHIQQMEPFRCRRSDLFPSPHLHAHGPISHLLLPGALGSSTGANCLNLLNLCSWPSDDLQAAASGIFQSLSLVMTSPWLTLFNGFLLHDNQIVTLASKSYILWSLSNCRHFPTSK